MSYIAAPQGAKKSQVVTATHARLMFRRIFHGQGKTESVNLIVMVKMGVFISIIRG